MAELKMPPGTVISQESLVFDVDGKPWWVDPNYKSFEPADLTVEEDEDEDSDDEGDGEDHHETAKSSADESA